MFAWTGIFLIITILAAIFGFRKKRFPLKRFVQFTFWVSLCLFLALLLVCILHVKYIISEGMREKWLIHSMQNSAQ